MSTRSVPTATDPAPNGWRAGTARVVVNAVLVLAAYELVALVDSVARVIVGWNLPLTPVEAVPLVAVLLLVRWLYVLPALLVALVILDYVARRVSHPRV